MKKPKNTQVRLKTSTCEALKRIGNKGQTYDQVIRDLIRIAESMNQDGN